jgi:hypothetical protein
MAQVALDVEFIYAEFRSKLCFGLNDGNDSVVLWR